MKHDFRQKEQRNSNTHVCSRCEMPATLRENEWVLLVTLDDQGLTYAPFTDEALECSGYKS